MSIQIFTKLPGGLMTMAGGTRTSVKLVRPWQGDFMAKGAPCPFVDGPEMQSREIEHFSYGGEEWRLIDNQFTPFEWHRMLIPVKCWEEEKLRVLGGFEHIATALGIIYSVAKREKRELLSNVHIGALAGQNVPHLHYHLLEPVNASREEAAKVTEAFREADAKLTISETPYLRVVAGGLRAGQCFIVPTVDRSEDEGDDEGDIMYGLAAKISQVIELYAKRFKPHHYMVGLRLSKNKFCYAFYVPILNHWGGTEYLGLIENTPLVLPWSHQETVRHLLASR